MMTMIVYTLLVFITVVQGELVQPDLEYAYDGLEPVVNNETVTLHHSKHFAGYINNVNAALANCGLEISAFDELATKILPTIGADQNCAVSSFYIEEIMKMVQPVMDALMNMVNMGNDTSDRINIDKLCPEEAQTIRNNGGGAFNHNFYFSILAPENSSSVDDIGDEFLAKIEQTFGSVENLISEMSIQGGKVFGSGWVWLLLVDGELQIVTTPNQDNPYMPFVQSGTPLLAIDVWEHAYYLKYKNRRAEYLDMIWRVVNWEKVDELFMDAI